jgi:pilus assembly protein CpaC
MVRRPRRRAAAVAAVTAVAGLLWLALAAAAALAQTPGQPPAAEPTRTLALEVGSGKLMTLPAAAANVFVADPKVAEVRPGTPDRLFIFGVGPGRTSVAALDAAGHTLADYRVTVGLSGYAAGQAQAAAAAAVPDGRVAIRAEPRGLLVSGQVDTPEDAARVLSIARGYLSEGQTLEDQIGVRSSIQVSLHVRIAEMSRQVTNQLGVNWQALGTIGNIGALPATNLALAGGSLNGGVLATCAAGTLFSVSCKGLSFDGLINALVQENLARILAEPNLTAMSGQPASFLAGGEFPIPVGQQNGEVTIEFKQYGVKLTFVPTVLSSGRINLHVSPEVSELTQQGAVQLTAGNSTISVPALTVRRAETTIEVGSGQSFAIAGLLLDTIQDSPSGLPLLSKIPVLGALFRSDSYQRQETELVVLVTPYIVRPVSDPTVLRVPGQDYQPPSDLERILLMRQAAGQPPPPVHIPSEAGFIVQ